MSAETPLITMLLARLNAETDGYFWRCNTGAARSGKYFIRFGVPGQPDIQGCHCGRWVGIEGKTERGKLSPAQKQFQDRIEKAGGAFVVARSWKDIQNEFRRNGLPIDAGNGSG
jgi:hypothetical protein